MGDGRVTLSTKPIGEDPVADSRNGEYVIVKPPGWSEERWDAYQRGLGGGAGTMADSAEFEGMWIAVEKYDAVLAELVRLRIAIEDYALWKPGEKGHAAAHRKLMEALR